MSSTVFAGDRAAAPSSEAPRGTTSFRRLDSVDLLRGVVMVLMALDHTRDYLGASGSPTDLTRASTALFLTRWVTHFCAPVFFLLTGTGARLSLGKRSKEELSWFLLTRGVWLLLLDTVLFRCLILQFNFDYRVTLLSVLWALGWSMIVLAGLVYLPLWATTAFGATLIATHDLFNGVSSDAPLWTVLHSPNVLFSLSGHTVFVAYPLIPWIGVTACGYGLGAVYAWAPDRRRAFLLWLGLGLCAAFVALRALGLYGDPFPWRAQPSLLRSVLSFLNLNKYPPSLLFLLMTLGPALLFLRAVERGTPRALRPALTLGRVPLFYFLLHFALVHTLAVVICGLRFGGVHWMFESPDLGHFPITQPPGWGLPLPLVWLLWLAVVAAVFPICGWFAGVKRRRPERWLSYL